MGESVMRHVVMLRRNRTRYQGPRTHTGDPYKRGRLQGIEYLPQLLLPGILLSGVGYATGTWLWLILGGLVGAALGIRWALRSKRLRAGDRP